MNLGTTHERGRALRIVLHVGGVHDDRGSISSVPRRKAQENARGNLFQGKIAGHQRPVNASTRTAQGRKPLLPRPSSRTNPASHLHHQSPPTRRACSAFFLHLKPSPGHKAFTWNRGGGRSTRTPPEEAQPRGSERLPGSCHVLSVKHLGEIMG